MKTKTSSPSHQSKRHSAVWTFAWVLTVLITTLGSKWTWIENKPFAILLLLLNVTMGVGMIWANKAYLDTGDELEKKIQLDAMALTLGATLVSGVAYLKMEQLNLIQGDAEVGVLVLFMGLVYILSVIIGKLRYR